MSCIRSHHPYLEVLEPYEPPDLEAAAERAGVERDELIRLIANENLFGPAPGVAEALAKFDAYHFHPDYQPLREAVADYASAAPHQVILSNGADELIDLLIRLFVEPGQGVVIAPPTFSMYGFYARVNRCRLLTAPRRDDLSLDVAAIERAVQGATEGETMAGEGEARMLFLVSPGNPSGKPIPLDVIERLLQLPVLVAVDEAYIEFGGQSALCLLPRHENLVILRTFSKWAGLAGLRLGYALMAPGLAADVERIRPPYNVNAAAIVAALATFANLDAVRANVARLIEERERLEGALNAFSWLRVFPSQANFILCRVLGRSAQSVIDGLLDRGILVRGFSGGRMEDYVRISVGRSDDTEALLEALRDVSWAKEEPHAG